LTGGAAKFLVNFRESARKVAIPVCDAVDYVSVVHRFHREGGRIMSPISRIICSLAVVAACSVATSEMLAAENTGDRQPAAAEANAKKREAGELASAAKSALRASNAAKTAKERDTAARELVQVFVELHADRTLASGSRHNLQQQVRHRLLAIETGLRSVVNSADSRQKNGGADKASGDSNDKPQSKGPSMIAIKDHSSILAQQVAPPAPAGAPPRVNNPPNGGQPPDDYGPELLELIQRVIRPASWDVNGGASSGYYYQPLHALVISAPDEIHEEIGGVVSGLRK
jgi:hypothetical protein